MKKIQYRDLQETLYYRVLENGLSVYLLPKKEVAKSFGVFMTNYGSVDRTFKPLNEKNDITVPDGIAHFLEHKLFEKEDRDVFGDFLRQGASPNAYTSFTKTAYLFSTTKLVEENVETLLDFVQEPYFSDESVEKEKGIIAQEIKMYDDQPDWQAFMGTIKNMYQQIPINIDIAGTIASIQEITKEDLYTCYHTFYHPSNMVLFVVGNFDEQSMIEKIQENQGRKTFTNAKPMKRILPEEPFHVHEKESVISLPVSIPKVTIGIKEKTEGLEKLSLLKRELLQEMLLDYFFSESGSFYEQLYNDELIDESFEFSTTMEQAYNFSLISSNTTNPDTFAERVTSMLLSTNSFVFEQKELDTMKKKRIGELLRSMNSLEHIANQYVHYHFLGVDYLELIPVIQSISLQDVQSFLQQWIDEDRLTVCKIMKQEERKHHAKNGIDFRS